MRSILSIMILAALVACEPAQNDPGPGGVTVGEAKALDEAAKMLDERNAPPESIETEPAASVDSE
tara:strand:- start:15518 stop:15712 length:195 start_codon:yes stop_codon:yes gene_type:complete